MNFSTLKLQQDGSVLRATLSNPPVNTVSSKMVEELFQLAGRLHGDTTVKVVLFDSEDPDFFLAHFDLNDLENSALDPSKASKFPEINVVQALSLTWQALPQISVGKVSGRVRGGGLEFLLGLHIRFASLESKFCFPEPSVGFLPCGGGATRVSFLSGPSRALELLLTSRDFDATEAERYGLINRALPADELDAYVEDLVGRVSKRSREVIAMNRAVLERVQAPFVETLFSGFAIENDGFRAGLPGAEAQYMQAELMKLAQAREVELDLPATIDRILAKRPQ